MDHNISLIAEQYGDIARKQKMLEDVDDLRGRVCTLEDVAKDHSAQFAALKRRSKDELSTVPANFKF